MTPVSTIPSTRGVHFSVIPDICKVYTPVLTGTPGPKENQMIEKWKTSVYRRLFLSN